MSKSTHPRDGLLLVGHGTRELAGIAEFKRAVEQVGLQRPDIAVEGCFLELAEPTISAGLAALAARGVRRVRAVPLVLFAAGHAKHDIPQALQQARRLCPGVEVRQLPHLGCHPGIVALSELRYRQALDAHPAVSARQTLLVLVGRGSHDPTATAEMLRFAQLRSERLAGVRVETGFVAMAQPRLEDVLAAAAESRARRVVVQPHLLFSGLLLAEIREAVAQRVESTPQIEWLIAAHLGPDQALVATVLDSLEKNFDVSPELCQN